MQVNEKIRLLRELNSWTQEDMAEKLHMSLNSYASLERGESKLHLAKLEQVAQVFDIEVLDLLALERQGLIFLVNGDGDNNNPTISYYGNSNQSSVEIEKLKLTLKHKDELLQQQKTLLAQQAEQITTLKELVAVLQPKK